MKKLYCVRWQRLPCGCHKLSHAFVWNAQKRNSFTVHEVSRTCRRLHLVLDWINGEQEREKKKTTKRNVHEQLNYHYLWRSPAPFIQKHCGRRFLFEFPHTAIAHDDDDDDRTRCAIHYAANYLLYFSIQWASCACVFARASVCWVYAFRGIIQKWALRLYLVKWFICDERTVHHIASRRDQLYLLAIHLDQIQRRVECGEKKNTALLSESRMEICILTAGGA